MDRNESNSWDYYKRKNKEEFMKLTGIELTVILRILVSVITAVTLVLEFRRQGTLCEDENGAIQESAG